MPVRRLPALIAAVALVAPGAWAAPAAAAPPRVGVVVTVEVNLEAGQGERLATAIGDALAGRLAIEVIAGPDATRRLPPGGVPDTCLAEPGCLADLGGRLAADQLLLIVAVQVGDRLQLDPTWVEPTTGRSVPRPAIEIGAALDDAARAALAEAAPRLLPDAALRPAAVAPAHDSPGGADAGPSVGALAAPSPGRHMTRGAWLATGVAGGALLGGIGLGLATLAKRSALEADGCGDTTACPGGADTLGRLALATDALLIGSLVAGGVAGWLYWRSDRTSLTLEPHAEGAALSLSGSF